MKIEGAPPEEVERLVAEKLGDNVVDISDSLFGLVEELCTGNPLMITELVSHLKVLQYNFKAPFPTALMYTSKYTSYMFSYIHTSRPPSPSPSSLYNSLCNLWRISIPRVRLVVLMVEPRMLRYIEIISIVSL